MQSDQNPFLPIVSWSYPGSVPTTSQRLGASSTPSWLAATCAKLNCLPSSVVSSREPLIGHWSPVSMHEGH